jgi:hypothetical protein
LSLAEGYGFEVREIYVFIPSTINSKIKNLINSLFKLEFHQIALKFFDSNDIIPHYLKYMVSQNQLNLKGSATKPLDYIILNRDLHHTHIKYFKLIPSGQPFKLNGQRYTLYYNVQEVDSIKFNYGNFDIEESIKRIIRKHIEDEGKPEYIANYRKHEELKNVEETRLFAEYSQSSLVFRYDTDEYVKISYEDFLEVLLPEYFQTEINVINDLSNKHASKGIVPIVHLFGIIYEKISERFFRDNLSPEIANYQLTNGTINQLNYAASTVIIGKFDSPVFLPRQFTLENANINANKHDLNKIFGKMAETNNDELLAFKRRIRDEQKALKLSFKQDMKVWNKFIKELEVFYSYNAKEIEAQWRKATRQVCSDDELKAAIDGIKNYDSIVSGMKSNIKTYIKNLYKSENKLYRSGNMTLKEYKPCKIAQEKLTEEAIAEIDRLVKEHQYNFTALNAAYENYKATIKRHDQY